MPVDPSHAIDTLNYRFFVEHPMDAAIRIEQLPLAEVVDAVQRQPVRVLAPVWQRLLPDIAAQLLGALPDIIADQLLAEMSPSHSVRLLGHMDTEEVSIRLSRLEPTIRKDLETLLSYPQDTAGRLMNANLSTFRRDATAGETLKRLRESGMNTARSLFLVDDDQHLTGKATLTDVALASAEKTLGELEHPISAIVRPIDTLEEITRIFEQGNILDLPVVDLDGVILGGITHDDIARTIQKDATADLQTMVGASKDERALSSPIFTVRKRMPWLQINLVTAFMDEE